MSPRWLRHRRREKPSRPSEPSSAAGPSPERGPHLVVERLDEDGTAILASLSNRYELEALDGGGCRFGVFVDEASFPHEAVVRMASQLDEIDPAWQLHLS